MFLLRKALHDSLVGIHTKCYASPHVHVDSPSYFRHISCRIAVSISPNLHFYLIYYNVIYYLEDLVGMLNCTIQLLFRVVTTNSQCTKPRTVEYIITEDSQDLCTPSNFNHTVL